MLNPPQLTAEPVVPPLGNSAEAVVTTWPKMSNIYLGGIFFLLLMTALREASSIVIPFVLALTLKLVFQPVLRRMGRLGVPHLISSLLVIGCLLSSIVFIGMMLSEPAANWGSRLPQSLPQIEQRLNFLRKPVEKTQKLLDKAEDLTSPASDTKVVAVAVEGPHLSDKILLGTQTILSGLFTTMLLLFFLLSAGDAFLRRFVEILPRFKDKRRVVDISQQIEHDISRYLLTITMMNFFVGCLGGSIMYFFHIGDPLLWATLAFLLNYIPIIGPFAAMSIFFFASLLTLQNPIAALVPVGCFFAVHIMESTFITPMLLARRFTINPVIVIMALIFWYWMWGIVGAILSMPMLAVLKIICDRIEPLAAFGHFLGYGNGREEVTPTPIPEAA